MRIANPQRWDLTLAEAEALQRQLRGEVITADDADFIEPRLVAGVDNSYVEATGTTYGGVVVLSWPDLRVVEQQVSRTPTAFPYVPGLLSFREAPGILAAIRLLEHEPDLFIFDGQGIAHPRGLGLASHLGLVLDRPSIGCAKSLLVGRYTEPGPRQGDTSPLTYGGRTVGTVLRPATGRKASRPAIASACRARRASSPSAAAATSCPSRRAWPTTWSHRRAKGIKVGLTSVRVGRTRYSVVAHVRPFWLPTMFHPLWSMTTLVDS